MSNRFEGKRFLITGGTNGIGLATAKRIVAEGGEVGVTGYSQKNLDQAGAELPPTSLVMRNDASDPDSIAELKEAVEKMGQIDGLFLNAGYGGVTPIGHTSVEDFDRMMNTNVRGPVLQMNALAPLVKDGGSILMTSSVAPYLGGPANSVYSATKACNASMARNWAAELAPRNIRVNAVAPGPIETGFGGRFADESNMTKEDVDGFFQRIMSQVPLQRMGKAEEVAAVACFLLSDDASYVTGSEYMVDGGMTMR